MPCLARGLQPAGQIDCFAPDMINIPIFSDQAGNHCPFMNPDTEFQTGLTDTLVRHGADNVARKDQDRMGVIRPVGLQNHFGIAKIALIGERRSWRICACAAVSPERPS